MSTSTTKPHAAAIYDAIGGGYASHRRADPRWSAHVQAAVAGARAVINVGAGAGSYEPSGPRVVAVEPSAVMIAQRPRTAAPVVRAVAEHLPFARGAFDAALALLTMHHWRDARRGLDELVRVARRQIVLTWDPHVFVDRFWLVREYLPEVVAQQLAVATLDTAAAQLDVDRVVALPVPADCTDGFFGAYWRRPHAYLDAGLRSAISTFAELDPTRLDAALNRLSDDLASGRWHERHAALLGASEQDLGYRLVIAGSR